jgi:hypothetical protein
MRITDAIDQAASDGYTHALVLGETYTLDELAARYAGHDVEGMCAAWCGLIVHFVGMDTVTTEEPDKATIDRVSAGWLSVTSSAEQIKYRLRTAVVFRLDLHPDADPQLAFGRIASARAAAGNRLDRSRYEQMCADYNVPPLADDEIVIRPRVLGHDHPADPTGRRRIAGVLDYARKAALPQVEVEHFPVALLDDGPRPHPNAGQDIVADLLGFPVPTEATQRGVCHYCGLRLVRGRCAECD